MPVLSDFGLWTVFAVAAGAILLFDFVFLARARQRLSPRKALLIVGIYELVALAFGGLIFLSRGSGSGMEYLAGLLIEQSLSFDNVFVWVLIFANLSTPDEHQETVLFWGILGAIVFRAVFIFGGIALLNNFEWLLYVFGAIVIVSGIRLLRSDGNQNVDNSRIMKFARAHLRVSKDFQGRKFIIRKGRSWCGTPLLLAVVVVELTDIFFALDSIPAIFGVTRDTLIVYTSNIFSVIGLMERLRYLHYGLAVLLLLIGAKMIAGNFVEIPVWMTLAGTLAIVTATMAVSLLWSRPKPAKA